MASLEKEYLSISNLLKKKNGGAIGASLELGFN